MDATNCIVFGRAKWSVKRQLALAKCTTRQLPRGAGHCQCGGLTDRKVCYIHGDAHLGYIHIPKLRSLGPLAAAGERLTYGRKARKYIRIYLFNKIGFWERL